jgi:hypothetical protein
MGGNEKTQDLFLCLKIIYWWVLGWVKA